MNDQTFMTVAGRIDTTADDMISGWAFDPACPSERVTLELAHEDRAICTFQADVFRDDLLEAGMGDGCHGFMVRLPSDIFTAPLIALRLRVVQTGVDLVGSPLLIRNHRTLVDGETLSIFSGAICDAARVAQSADDLRGLSKWLIEHFDLVYQRQTSLNDAASARGDQFSLVIGQNSTLSSVLRQAADAVVAGYPPLSLPDVDQPDVSVIIPAYGNFNYTYRCLKSIVDHLPTASIEVVLVDDASTDETIYAGLVLRGGIRIVRNARNQGFLESSMNGVRSARGAFLLFLNNDTEVQGGWLDALLGTFDQDDAIGIAGSKLIYPDGRLQEAGGIIWRQGTGWNYGRGQDANDPRYRFMRDVDYVSGAALLIRRHVFDAVYGFSPEFAPGYYEDTDLCFKVRAAGYRVVVQPASVIVHYEGATAGTDVNSHGMKRFQRLNQRVFLQKWYDVLQSHELEGADPHAAAERTVQRRVLFIDDTVLTPDRDAGSNAALEHIRSLQRLGFKISFVGADNMACIPPYTAALEEIGVQNYYAPYYWSVEEIIRRERVTFDIFYVHRVANFTKYAPMIRQRFPAARVFFSVADLHHLRLEREAVLKNSAALADTASKMKELELAAIQEADRVIVHSAFERDFIQSMVKDADVRVIPWVFRPRPVPAAFDERHGLAFIGGYNHSPNVDAAVWLVDEVMPLVHAHNPDIVCTLVGSDMPPVVHGLARPRVRVLGHVPNLEPFLATLRLTVAPLRYGAGLKGKVLTSLAAGLPCVCTPCAVEGMEWPCALDPVIGASAEELAARIVRLHEDGELNAQLAQEGISFIERGFSAAKVDTLMAGLVN